MNARTRDIVILRRRPGLVLGAALGGYAVVRARADGGRGAPGARAGVMPTPSAAGGSPGAAVRALDGGHGAGARSPCRAGPRDGARAGASAACRRRRTTRRVVLVDEVREVDGVPWYRVWLAVPPNESRGWVRDGQMAFYTTASKIVIDLSRARAHGVSPRRAHAHVPRRGGTPRPRDAHRALLRHPEAAATGPERRLRRAPARHQRHQPKLNGWPDGGLVAIHGTNEPWLIGKAVSHGCVRMTNAAVLEVSRAGADRQPGGHREVAAARPRRRHAALTSTRPGAASCRGPCTSGRCTRRPSRGRRARCRRPRSGTRRCGCRRR